MISVTSSPGKLLSLDWSGEQRFWFHIVDVGPQDQEVQSDILGGFKPKTGDNRSTESWEIWCQKGSGCNPPKMKRQVW